MNGTQAAAGTISQVTITPTPPHRFRYDLDGALVCNHRNLSCCRVCAAAWVQIVDVAGRHFWIEDPDERRLLNAITES